MMRHRQCTDSRRYSCHHDSAFHVRAAWEQELRRASSPNMGATSFSVHFWMLQWVRVNAKFIVSVKHRTYNSRPDGAMDFPPPEGGFRVTSLSPLPRLWRHSEKQRKRSEDHRKSFRTYLLISTKLLLSSPEVIKGKFVNTRDFLKSFPQTLAL